MLKKTLPIFFLIILALFFPKVTKAFDFDFIGKIKDIAGYVKTAQGAIDNSASEDTPHRFIFGGKITHSEGGCHIKAKFCPAGICKVGVSVITIPIPNGGNTIEVGSPVPSPKGQMFTFLGITDIYANKNTDKEGHWALGTGFTPFPIDKINDALGKIPNIPVPYGSIGDFHLECSKSNKAVILKIGTS